MDVEISRGAWKGREGKQVRATVGTYRNVPQSKAFTIERLLRACVGPVIYCDTAGLHLAKFRDVFHVDVNRRYRTWKKFISVFEYMETQRLGKVVRSHGRWPCFVKASASKKEVAAVVQRLRAPSFSFPYMRIYEVPQARPDEPSGVTNVTKADHAGESSEKGADGRTDELPTKRQRTAVAIAATRGPPEATHAMKASSADVTSEKGADGRMDDLPRTRQQSTGARVVAREAEHEIPRATLQHDSTAAAQPLGAVLEPERREGASDDEGPFKTVFTGVVRPRGLTSKARKEVIRETVLKLSPPFRVAVDQKRSCEDVDGVVCLYFRAWCSVCNTKTCPMRVGIWWTTSGQFRDHMRIKVAGVCPGNSKKSDDGKMLFNAEAWVCR